MDEASHWYLKRDILSDSVQLGRPLTTWSGLLQAKVGIVDVAGMRVFGRSFSFYFDSTTRILTQ
jgi:hypothetical protein